MYGVIEKTYGTHHEVSVVNAVMWILDQVMVPKSQKAVLKIAWRQIQSSPQIDIFDGMKNTHDVEACSGGYTVVNNHNLGFALRGVDEGRHFYHTECKRITPRRSGRPSSFSCSSTYHAPGLSPSRAAERICDTNTIAWINYCPSVFHLFLVGLVLFTQPNVL